MSHVSCICDHLIERETKNLMCLMCMRMSHVTRAYESCLSIRDHLIMFQAKKLVCRIYCLTYLRISHITRMHESCLIHMWLYDQLRGQKVCASDIYNYMSHVTHIHESCPIHMRYHGQWRGQYAGTCHTCIPLTWLIRIHIITTSFLVSHVTIWLHMDETCLMHTRDIYVTHAYVWHDSLTYETLTCHAYARRDSYVIQTRDMWHDSHNQARGPKAGM